MLFFEAETKMLDLIRKVLREGGLTFSGHPLKVGTFEDLTETQTPPPRLGAGGVWLNDRKD